MAQETSRLSAAEIFDRVTAGAADELERPSKNLAFSAVAAGLSMGLSGLGVAVLLHALPDGGASEPLAYLAYPLGFVVVVLGRQQLFTENTLFPVALVLRTRRHVANTARLWAVVLVGNLLGALLFAALVVLTPALPGGVGEELRGLGVSTGSTGAVEVFWTGVVAGWIIALVAWLVTASTTTSGQLLVLVLLTYVVGVGHFAHSIAGTAEVLVATLAGDLPLPSLLSWTAVAVAGNAVGGVVIVALFNYGQVHAEGDGEVQHEQEQQLQRAERDGTAR